MDASTNPLGIKRLPVPKGVVIRTVISRSQIGAIIEASAIRDQALLEFNELIKQAQSEADQIRENTRVETEKLVLKEAQGILEDLQNMRQQVAEQSMEAAQAILQKAWEILIGDLSKPERTLCSLEQARRYFVSTSLMRLRVHPASMADAELWLENQRRCHPGLELLTLEPDVTVRPDEVRLYLDRGGVIRADFAGTVETLKAQWN
jgi:flagellar hook-basal body complex protein FliE